MDLACRSLPVCHPSLIRLSTYVTKSWMNMQELAVLRHLGKCFDNTEDFVTVFTLKQVCEDRDDMCIQDCRMEFL